MTPVYKLSASSIKGRTNYGSMLAGNTAFFPGAFESIATVTVGSGGASSAVFSSIPGTYAHLQIRAIGRTDRSGFTNDPFRWRFNSDSGSNYAQHYLTGDGSAAASFGASSATFNAAYLASATNATASVMGVMVLDILDYANTNKYKTTRVLGGYDNNGDGQVAVSSGLWMNTNAITTITLTPQVGSNWQQYSHFALYGIKGAA